MEIKQSPDPAWIAELMVDCLGLATGQHADREVLRLQVLRHGPRSSLPIERQLAHAEYLPVRRKMMQAWADCLDGLKAGAEVIPLFRKA